MIRTLLLFMIISLFATPGYAVDDTLEQAAKLYKKNRYESAAARLRFGLERISPDKKGHALLSLGIFYLSNAELYRDFHGTSVSVNLDYLRKISTAQGKDKSRIANLFLGEALLETDSPREAAKYFKKISNSRKVDARYRSIAKAKLGLSYHLMGDSHAADVFWSNLNAKADAELLSELAAAYSRAGLAKKDPASMCKIALLSVKTSGKKPSMRLINNCTGVFAGAGLVEDGLDLLGDSDTRAFSYEEVLDRNKTILFYDLSLLGNISKLYSKASILYLGKASKDGKVGDMALYYLSKAYAHMGMVRDSAKAVDSVIASGHVPGRYKSLARIGNASNLYMKGRKAKAVGMWEQLSQKHGNDPDLLAEIVLACCRHTIECPEAVSRAMAMAEAGGGRKLFRVNFAIGKYYLEKKDYAKAIAYMEAGRDKSNKNNIEYNAPPLLVDLARAYYHSKKFSEALEIYFEMSKQFPAVRQIQVAMQGIYSMEQKSAGDVKVF